LNHIRPSTVYGNIADPLGSVPKQNLKNLETVDIGEGRHFVQEDNPHAIGEALSDWYQTIN